MPAVTLRILLVALLCRKELAQSTVIFLICRNEKIRNIKLLYKQQCHVFYIIMSFLNKKNLNLLISNINFDLIWLPQTFFKPQQWSNYTQNKKDHWYCLQSYHSYSCLSVYVVLRNPLQPRIPRSLWIGIHSGRTFDISSRVSNHTPNIHPI